MIAFMLETARYGVRRSTAAPGCRSSRKAFKLSAFVCNSLTWGTVMLPFSTAVFISSLNLSIAGLEVATWAIAVGAWCNARRTIDKEIACKTRFMVPSFSVGLLLDAIDQV